MRDVAVDCRQTESRFSIVNTCNLTDTDKDMSCAVLRGQGTSSARVNPLKTVTQLNDEGIAFTFWEIHLLNFSQRVS